MKYVFKILNPNLYCIEQVLNNDPNDPNHPYEIGISDFNGYQ